MLSLSLDLDEYVTIGKDIVVSFNGISKGRCCLGIEADRNIPILRSEVLERNGTPPPACIASRPPRRKKKPRPDTLYRWNDDRERAARAMRKIADRLEANGAADEAETLRRQLDRLLPAVWEDEIK